MTPTFAAALMCMELPHLGARQSDGWQCKNLPWVQHNATLHIVAQAHQKAKLCHSAWG